MSKTDKAKPGKGKAIPPFSSDEAAERFVETADLSEYDLSGFKRMSLEALMKEVQVNVRLPQPLYQAVKDAAAKQGVPYSRFVRSALEAAVQPKHGQLRFRE
jgi:predicted DNA binding CopG/RHH family protein